MKNKLIMIALIAGMAWASNEDYKDAVAEQATYCAMVKAGKWPAYREGVVCN